MDIRESVVHTLQCESDIVSDLIKTVDQEQIEKVIAALMDCKGKVIITGCGTSGVAAQKIEHTLSCVNCPALFLSPSNALHGGMGVVAKEDILIMLSKGGHTKELDDMVAPCKERGAFLISVTENEESYMAKESDLVLKIKVDKEPDDYNVLATGSIVGTIAVFDAIAIVISRLKGFSRDGFLKIHPGGDVGKRLAEGDNR